MNKPQTEARHTQTIIINPRCPACGTRADGLLDRVPCNSFAAGTPDWYICPNLNCEHEWQPETRDYAADQLIMADNRKREIE